MLTLSELQWNLISYWSDAGILRKRGRLHRLLHHGEQFLPHLIQVHFAAQSGTERRDDFGRIICATVEAAIDALLEAMARVERTMATLLSWSITPRSSCTG
jgi:hypothetical protein